MTQRELLLAVALAASGCADPGPGATDPIPETCLRVDVERIAMDLEGTPRGEASVALRNACATPLPITVESSDLPSLAVLDAPTSIPALGSAWLTVSYTAGQVGEVQGSLSIRADRVVDVPIAIEAHGPVIRAEAPPAARTPTGCTREHRLTLSNTGDRPGTIRRLERVEGSAFTLVAPDLPITLAPGASLEVPVTFHAAGAALQTARVRMTSDDPFIPTATVDLADESWHPNPQLLTVTTPQPLVDLLLTLDRSSCNTEHLEAVPEMIGVLRDGLAQADYQVAIVTADSGCVLGDDPFITPSFAASAATRAAETMIDMDFVLSPYGANAQRGLTLADAALDETGPGGCNEGLLREDAFLHLVHHSHKADQSLRDWSSFVAGFRALTDDRVMHHAVVGGEDSRCAAPGHGYLDAQQATGGLWMDYCATQEGSWIPAWDEHFAALSTHILEAGEHTIVLPVPPVPGETLEVRVSGQVVEAWSYDAETRAITLPNSVARPGSEVVVRWSGLPESCP